MGSVTRRVVTFYSFKGGVGRTFALCDVAVYLARWGYRVLCVDLDLEAPGLTRYFNGSLKDNNCPGMLEVLDAWAKDANDEAISAEAIVPVDLFATDDLPGTNGRLALVKSGRGGDDYVRRLHAVDWQRLFDEQRAGRRLEALRERWLDQFDFVLIDSRTGWSDVGEICTIHLPDILVTLFAPNDQSLDGALAVADASKAGVARLPLDRAPLRIVPVLSRVDKDEYEAQQEWTERLLEKASRFLKDWDPEEETPSDVLAQIVVPYVPYWSYGERLAALRTERVSSLSVGRAHETLAALLAHSLSEAGRLLRQRESYVEEAAIGKSVTALVESTAEYDFYISYSTAYQNVARDLADALRKRESMSFLTSGCFGQEIYGQVS
jgi:MinD-like ATPase involved in chromosome partitioning or flagellar assembly